MAAKKSIKLFVKTTIVPVDLVPHEVVSVSGAGAGLLLKHTEMRFRYESVMDGASKDLAADARELAERCGAEFEIVDVAQFNPLRRFFAMLTLKRLPTLVMHGVTAVDLVHREGAGAMKAAVESGPGIVKR